MEGGGKIDLNVEEEVGSLGPKNEEDDLAFPLPSITNFFFFLRWISFPIKADKCVEKMMKKQGEDSLMRCVATTRSVGIYRDNVCYYDHVTIQTKKA